MRLRARVDGNQANIVKGLRSCGVTVAITSQLGKGFPDILCLFRGRLVLFEIKDPDQPKSKQKLTPLEEAFHKRWHQAAHVITTAEEAMAILGNSLP